MNGICFTYLCTCNIVGRGACVTGWQSGGMTLSTCARGLPSLVSLIKHSHTVHVHTYIYVVQPLGSSSKWPAPYITHHFNSKQPPLSLFSSSWVPIIDKFHRNRECLLQLFWDLVLFAVCDHCQSVSLVLVSLLGRAAKGHLSLARNWIFRDDNHTVT